MCTVFVPIQQNLDQNETHQNKKYPYTPFSFQSSNIYWSEKQCTLQMLVQTQLKYPYIFFMLICTHHCNSLTGLLASRCVCVLRARSSSHTTTSQRALNIRWAVQAGCRDGMWRQHCTSRTHHLTSTGYWLCLRRCKCCLGSLTQVITPALYLGCRSLRTRLIFVVCTVFHFNKYCLN